jgi:hypothetical protein
MDSGFEENLRVLGRPKVCRLKTTESMIHYLPEILNRASKNERDTLSNGRSLSRTMRSIANQNQSYV